MSLLYMDGFDLDSGSLGPWTGAYSPFTTTRFGTGRSVTDAGNSDMKLVIPASGTLYVGFALNPHPTSGGGGLSLWGDGGTTRHLTVGSYSFNPGVIAALRGDTGGTSLGSASLSSGWHYIEVMATIADSGGRCVVRIDGGTTAVIDFTGDTKNGGTATDIDAISFRNAGSSLTYYDDLYICDDSGSVNNTFLGDCRIHTLSPDGNGASSGFVGSDGNSTDNYLLVDEAPYSTADYVAASASGTRDSYSIADLPGPATIYAVQQRAVALKSDAGAMTLKQSIRLSSTNYDDSSATALGTSATLLRTLRETNPATSAAWSASEVNGAEIGVLVP